MSQAPQHLIVTRLPSQRFSEIIHPFVEVDPSMQVLWHTAVEKAMEGRVLILRVTDGGKEFKLEWR